MNGQAGKGDSPRPMFISREEYVANWERIFGKKQPKAPQPKKEQDKEHS
ncbi:MAG TPA: hypothetical protein VHP11_02485 [Tepidisphaeraceae bacterium]|nr:hypothetical protein [Tepidisphaeraceae bacterium]